MSSLGPRSVSTARPGKFTGLGTIALAVVFLVALVFAANNNTVLGWFLAAVALGWLALSTFVYIGVRKAAAFGADQVRRAQAQLAGAASGRGEPAATRLVSDDGADERRRVRDMKLDHSFKIIQVQLGVIADSRGKDQETVDRALETIAITAHNGRSMIDPDRGEEPVSGVVLD